MRALRFTTTSSVFLVALAASAQDPPRDKKDPQAAIEPRSAPGAGQKFLEKFVGTWDVEKSFFPRAGQPARSKGECRQEMIHGGRFLRSEFTFEGDAGRTTGTGLIGYESDSGKFTSVWTDSRSTRMSLRVSRDKFDGKEIVLFGAAPDGAPVRQSRTVTRLEADGAKIVHRQYAPTPDGKERLVMELVMTRKPPR